MSDLAAHALERFLDEVGLGAGVPVVEPIGNGRSNLTYLISRGDERFVLRRPPPPPLPPSTHDVIREARVLRAVERAGVPVPRVLAVVDDARVLGAPFYVMAYVDGVVVDEELPVTIDAPVEHERLGFALVDTLALIHGVDIRAAGLERLGRPDGYLGRQLRRFRELSHLNAGAVPLVDEVADRLEAHLPGSGPPTLVHGDYRLGNVMLDRLPPARVLAVVDWELATIGDPLADLGYLIAYASPRSRETGIGIFEVTAETAFPSREQLARRYELATGRPVEALAWYETLALWKSAILLQGIYARRRREGRPADDLPAGIERLLEIAREHVEGS